jgi:hypothetical protein
MMRKVILGGTGFTRRKRLVNHSRGVDNVDGHDCAIGTAYTKLTSDPNRLDTRPQPSVVGAFARLVRRSTLWILRGTTPWPRW